MKTRLSVCFLSTALILSTGLHMLSPQALLPQEAHAFYLNLFKKGQSAFLLKDYKEALKNFEVALFGLHGQKRLMGQGYAYMSLCAFHLEQREKSEELLKKSAQWLEADEARDFWTNLPADERDRFDKMVKDFGVSLNLGVPAAQAQNTSPPVQDKREKVPVEKPKEIEKPVEKPDVAKTQQKAVTETPVTERPLRYSPPPAIQDPAADLENKIAEAPQNSSLYYQLYDLYIQRQNLQAAEQVLRRLILQSPVEVNAYMTLGQLLYRQRRFAEAGENFEGILRIAGDVPVEAEAIKVARAYRLLCLHAQEERRKAREVFLASQQMFSPAGIAGLPLDSAEKDRLNQIVSIYQEAGQSPEEGVLTDIVLYKGAETLEVEFLCDPSTSHQVFEIKDPRPQRIVIDFFDLIDIRATRLIPVKDYGIDVIRSGMYKKNIARVVFDALGELPRYRIEKSVMGLRIVLTR